MKSKRLLACDVDLCLVSTDIGWRKWLRNQSEVQYNLGDYEQTPYNLGKLFPLVEDTHKYWRELDYSPLKPIEGSVHALQALSQYFGIVFISSIKGNHTKSKYYWLKENFPFMEGYIATKEKYLMNNSVVAMIDDRLSMLEGFDPDKRILFETIYKQDVECSVDYSFKTWDDNVVKHVCEMYL